MNIDYSEIIAKANARKEALQALDEELKLLESHAGVLFDVLDYFEKLTPLLDAVDLEGRAMLGPVPARLFEISARCRSLRAGLATDACNATASMPYLLHFMRTYGAAK